MLAQAQAQTEPDDLPPDDDVWLRPQSGPQEAFLSCGADICIYGGAAGGGKTFAALLEVLRHVIHNRRFRAVFFRRTTPQITNPGGLWEEAAEIYPLTGGVAHQQMLEYRWPEGGKVKFAHLEYEATKNNWQGAQVPLFVFDELTHYSETMFWYFLSRNRSTCGVRPYIRATCNPDADSWVARLIAWWIDQKTGLAIPERSGVVRWFVRVGDKMVWGDASEEAVANSGLPAEEVRPKSLTFIAAKLSDNPALEQKNPDYRANLMALGRVERERLLGGNWKIRPAAGLYFKRHEVTILKARPTDVRVWIRQWDLAATAPGEGAAADPDWTAGVLVGLRASGRIVIGDVIHERLNSFGVRGLVSRTARADGLNVIVGLNQDPGQAGKDQAGSYAAMLAGFRIKIAIERGDKVLRADPFAAQWQATNVDVVEGPWNEDFLAEMEGFPDARHDDQVDAVVDGWKILITPEEIPPEAGFVQGSLTRR